MRFLLNLGEVSALQSLRVKKSWHLRQGCMKIHRLAWVDACFSSPLAFLSMIHVFFSLLGCLQLFYHWQAGLLLRRYQIKPQCINQWNQRSWVKRQSQGFLIKPNAECNTARSFLGCLCTRVWFSTFFVLKGGERNEDRNIFTAIWQTNCPL